MPNKKMTGLGQVSKKELEMLKKAKPKVATPRKRPTGTPRGPQVSPRKRNFRFRGRRT